MVREIDELTKAVADEQANVKVLEDLVEAHHQHMAAMAQVWIGFGSSCLHFYISAFSNFLRHHLQLLVDHKI